MAEQSILVDGNYNSDGDGYATGSEISTASIESSIFNYRYENGRRYHAYPEGKYPLPNDEKEQDRLDIVHHIFLLMLDGELHLAPIGENPQRILDVGTGTGIWAIDAGERYPSAEVIGTDLSPIQPSWVPSNVQFQIDDAEMPWTWSKNSFDLIHMRHLSGAINDWPALLEQAYIHTKPGGYAYIQEYEMTLDSDDGTYNENTSLWRYYDLINKAAAKSGREFKLGAKMAPLLEEAGFEEVTTHIFKVPFGTWAANKRQKEIGAFSAMSGETAFEAFGLVLLTKGLGMSKEEVVALADACRKELKTRRIHCYSRQYIYYGRKPLE